MISNPLSDQLTLKDLKSLSQIEIYCCNLIKDSDTKFYPNVAAQLLMLIILYCVKSGVFKFNKLMEIVNSDRLFICELLNRFPETQEGCKILNNEKSASNILQVIRFNLEHQREGFVNES